MATIGKCSDTELLNLIETTASGSPVKVKVEPEDEYETSSTSNNQSGEQFKSQGHTSEPLKGQGQVKVEPEDDYAISSTSNIQSAQQHSLDHTIRPNDQCLIRPETENDNENSSKSNFQSGEPFSSKGHTKEQFKGQGAIEGQGPLEKVKEEIVETIGNMEVGNGSESLWTTINGSVVGDSLASKVKNELDGNGDYIDDGESEADAEHYTLLTRQELINSLHECRTELDLTKKKLEKTERQLEKSNDYNSVLRNMVEKISSELHRVKHSKTVNVSVQVDKDDFLNYTTGADSMPKWNADNLSTVPMEMDSCVIIEEELCPPGVTPASKRSPEKQVSVADMVKQAAESVVQQQQQDMLSQSGYVYDSTTSLYYHSQTGYYYDSERQLFYDPKTGTYYYFDYDTGKYMFHSQVETQPTNQAVKVDIPFKVSTGKKIKDLDAMVHKNRKERREAELQRNKEKLANDSVFSKNKRCAELNRIKSQMVRKMVYAVDNQPHDKFDKDHNHSDGSRSRSHSRERSYKRSKRKHRSRSRDRKRSRRQKSSKSSRHHRDRSRDRSRRESRRNTEDRGASSDRQWNRDDNAATNGFMDSEQNNEENPDKIKVGLDPLHVGLQSEDYEMESENELVICEEGKEKKENVITISEEVCVDQKASGQSDNMSEHLVKEISTDITKEKNSDEKNKTDCSRQDSSESRKQDRSESRKSSKYNGSESCRRSEERKNSRDSSKSQGGRRREDERRRKKSRETKKKDNKKEKRKNSKTDGEKQEEEEGEIESGECSESDSEDEVTSYRSSSSSVESWYHSDLEVNEESDGEVELYGDLDEQPETIECDAELAANWPPCIRMIVTESSCLPVGTLYIVTCTGSSVGRDKADISINDINVSKSHAQIQYNEAAGVYELVDIGSQNGTLVNGKRISQKKKRSEPVPISHGDALKFGETRLLCHIHSGTDTCDDCEPGVVMANQPVVKQKEQILTKEERKKLQRQQMNQIKRKYGLQSAPYVENQEVFNNPNYEDKASTRRQTVGSDVPGQKTEAPASTTKPISKQNIGHKMLAKMGWKEGDSLGKNNEGLQEPIAVTLRANQSAGLGSASAGNFTVDDASSVDIKKATRRIQAQQRFNKIETTEGQEMKPQQKTWNQGDTEQSGS